MIAFVQVTSPEIKEYSKYSTEINKRYCDKHGYSFLEIETVNCETYAPQWSKIFTVLELLKTNLYDYVFFLDADAVVLNDSVTLEDLIKDLDSPIAFSINDWNGGELINTGAFLCSKEAVPYLEECIKISILEPGLKLEYWHEQTAINRMYTQGWKMTVWPMNKINSYWLHDYKTPSDQFVYHFMARPLAEKIQIAEDLFKLKNIV